MRYVSRICTGAAFLILLLAPVSYAVAAVSRDQLIATYIYRLADRIQWANEAQIDRYQFHLVDDNGRLARELGRIAASRQLHGKPFIVTHSSDEQIPDGVHLVYVSDTKTSLAPSVFAQVEGRNALMISDNWDNRRQLMINLREDEADKLGFEINRANIVNQGLGVHPDIILLGGTELDVARLYREGQQLLLQEHAELEAVREESAGLRGDVGGLRAERDNLSLRIEKQNKRLSDQEGRFEILNSRIVEQETSLQRQSEALEEREAVIRRQQAGIDQRAAVLERQDRDIKARDATIQDQERVLAEFGETLALQERFLLLVSIVAILVFALATTFLIAFRSNRRTNRLLVEQKRQLEESSQALEIAKEAAEAASLSKSRFLANMSHELRTPLNAILGFSQMMARDLESGSELYEKTAIINRSGQHLLAVINDVLDMSKIEAGREDLQPAPFDLLAAISDSVEIARARADAKGLSFWVEVDEVHHPFVETDRAKLSQILINLLGNAVKFTAEGGVALRASTTAIDEETVCFRVEVEDSGRGVAPEQLAEIFEPFTQAGEKVRSQAGTGLGLSISKHYVELLGGTIEAESELEVGTQFVVDVPLKLSSEAATLDTATENRLPSSLASGQTEWRVLIADDDKTNRLLLSSQLARVGIVAREAVDGDQAVQIFKEWAPHFIWMDMRMPVMNGYEATRVIRGLPGGDEVKIAAITASVFSDQREKILSAGCDAIVHKPYQEHEIFDTMAEYTGMEFVYEYSLEEASSLLTAEELNEALEVVDTELAAEMLVAVEECDPGAMDRLIDRLPDEQAKLARELRALAGRFDWDALESHLLKRRERTM